MHTIRVWDLPTRVFHWSLAFCVLGLLVTAQLGGGWMNWHFRLGYAVLSLLLFRFVWGFVGGYWSRFAHFSFGMRATQAYLLGHRKPAHTIGHNPLGALSVFALLLILLFQVSTGLFSDDEIAFSGPLTRLVSADSVSFATSYHTTIGKLLVLFLVILHVLAIVFYRVFRKQALTLSMITGDKPSVLATPSSRDSIGLRLLAVLLWFCCAAGVWFLVIWGTNP